MRFRFGILGALLAVSACGKAGEAPPSAALLSPENANDVASAFSPDGSRVAFWRSGSQGWELTVAGADLGNPQKLATTSGNFNQPPVWSPDGKSIAFVSDVWSLADIAVVAAEGGEPRRLTDAPGIEVPIIWHPAGDRLNYLATTAGGTFHTAMVSLSSGQSVPLLKEARPHIALWSPDGSRFAYMLLDRGKQTIWVADSSGANARQLTTEGQEGFAGPGSRPWSPDGKELVYVSTRTGTGDIWVVPVDGGSPRQLTRDIRDDNIPVWSADGKWVAFRSNRGRQSDVWIVPAAGGPELRVTDDPEEEGDLQWVGKANKLAFHTGTAAQGLFAVSVADGKEVRLTPDSIRVGGFDVSPDGSQVAYQILRGGGVSELAVMPVAGGTSRTLVSGTSDNSDPDWSPDGKSILFSSNRSGVGNIWIVDAAGGEARQLTTWTEGAFNAEWAADGSSVYFVSLYDAAPLEDVWMVSPKGGEPRRVTTVGTINSLAVSRTSPHIFVSTIGSRAGQFFLSEVLPGGKLRTVWDKSNVFGVSHAGVFAQGDSLAISGELPGGGQGSFLISILTGQGHQILDKGDFAGDFSPDGTQMAYVTGSPVQDLGLYSVKDGSSRKLTSTPENEAGYWWAGNHTIVVRRDAPRRRIATVDVSELLRKGGQPER